MPDLLRVHGWRPPDGNFARARGSARPSPVPCTINSLMNYARAVNTWNSEHPMGRLAAGSYSRLWRSDGPSDCVTRRSLLRTWTTCLTASSTCLKPRNRACRSSPRQKFVIQPGPVSVKASLDCSAPVSLVPESIACTSHYAA